MSTDLIRPILIGHPDVFSLTGFTYGVGQKEIRCWRVMPPAGQTIQLPYLIYADTGGVDAVPVNSFRSFQVVSWGSDEIECQTLSKAVKSALKDFSGEVNSTLIEGISQTFFQDALYESSTGFWYSIRKFSILYEED